MNADMGSGVSPTSANPPFTSNYGTRAYVRVPNWHSSANDTGLTPLTGEVGMTPRDTGCYDRRMTTDGTPAGSWNPTLFFGGDGGDAAGCN